METKNKYFLNLPLGFSSKSKDKNLFILCNLKELQQDKDTERN
jgi:hypothetical protein